MTKYMKIKNSTFTIIINTNEYVVGKYFFMYEIKSFLFLPDLMTFSRSFTYKWQYRAIEQIEHRIEG